MSGRPVTGLPRIDLLTPRQQMAMNCARCAQHLGMSGRVWGEVRHQGLLFRLWICVPDCSTPVPGDPA
ncbi:hypothetical protein [Streptomyces sp. P9-A2]|uniref:hypothetical protein n=1 Tax=Streptomyces sp. P9-A2 TaxID=3072284 RepID=UPI002FC8BB39